MKCVYCNQEIRIPSKEHIIQNAIGGVLESEKICCGACNNFLSKQIDKPFTDLFKSIVMHMPDFQKTNNNKSSIWIKAQGITSDNKKFDVIVKDRKITSCPELQKTEKGSYNPDKFIGYNFELFSITDNYVFLSGIRKIAFNYAVDYLNNNNLPVDLLLSGISVIRKSDIELDIRYNQLTLPYYPLTCFDDFIEKQDTEIYHNLLLFSFENKLWCYVGLFNTFKYYVCLSENCNFFINKSYCQLIRKIPHDTSYVNYRKIKQKLLLAQEYEIDPNLEDEEFKKQVCIKINKMNKIFDYYAYINNLITNTVFLYKCIKENKEFLPNFSLLYKYYTDEINYEYEDYNDEEVVKERYINSKYKESLLLIPSKEYSYPDFLFNYFDEEQCKQYCSEQITKLALYIKNNNEGE